VYRDGNMYAGHVPKSWTDHGGWVDPVKFLRTQPRASAYVPPPVPLVEVRTATAPVGMPGASDGFAYWNERDGAGVVTYRGDLAGGAQSVLSPGDFVPAFDVRRYSVALLSAPATGFTVGDRLPVLSVTVAHETPVWGARARLTATLVNAIGKPLAGARVTLQRLAGSARVAAAGGLTGTDGRASLSCVPLLKTTVRVRFAPPAVQPVGAEYVGAASATLTITPHVRLGTPKTAAKVTSGKAVTVTGAIAPRQPAGKRGVRLVFERYDGAAWVAARTVPATVGLATATSSRYSAVVRLRRTGAWRVRAERPADTKFAGTESSWREFVVR
jgi:hypothetical protein